MRLNIKKWFKSMVWYFLGFIILEIIMLIFADWKMFSKETAMLLFLGFCVSGIINATTFFEKDNFDNNE